MSKVIAILEKPKDCESCVFGRCQYSLPLSKGVKGYYCQLLPPEQSKVHEFDYDAEVHLDNCPIRPMPEKREVSGKYPQTDGIVPSYKIGWNACIDAIGGGDSD